MASTHTKGLCGGWARAEEDWEREGERENLAPPFLATHEAPTCNRSRGLGCSGSPTPLILILILIKFDQRAQLACMKTSQFAFSLSSTPFGIHPCWSDTSWVRVESHTSFRCSKLCTPLDLCMPSLDSLLDMCYWTILMTYYVTSRERKSQKWPGNGSCGPWLDLYLSPW